MCDKVNFFCPILEQFQTHLPIISGTQFFWIYEINCDLIISTVYDIFSTVTFNRFNTTTVLCLSQTRTWISNTICHGLFVFNELRSEVIVHFVSIINIKLFYLSCFKKFSSVLGEITIVGLTIFYIHLFRGCNCILFQYLTALSHSFPVGARGLSLT
jgi:hypothetical protein